MLIGVDYPNFYFSLKDIRGIPGQSIARLTSLGWTCIGNSNNTTTNWHQNQYTRTDFSSTNDKLGKIGDNISKFWGVEDISDKVGNKMMSPGDKVELAILEKA